MSEGARGEGQGAYAVGVRPLYFHDTDRPFDSWNSEHASDGYTAMLRDVNASGERQIVAAHMWYPTNSADSGRPATLADFSKSASDVFSAAYERNAVSFSLVEVSGPDLQPGGEIFSKPELLNAISDEMKRRIITASYGADIAEGSFPVIVAAHGLGGTSIMWSLFAEYLASNGYIVIAPSFVSDSGAPHVFESPDSRYAAAAGTTGLNRAYETIMGESKVVPNFYRYFFNHNMEAEEFPDPSQLQFVSGGGERVGAMMAGLFDQRVSDVQTIIDGIESLHTDSQTCAAAYAQRGQPVHGKEVCGLFTGAFDLDSIGVIGHSLGSMTAQFSAARDDRIVTAVGYNNGPPHYWEPTGIFGTGTTDDGQPVGVAKPLLQIHGSEDAFVQNVFRGIMWNILSAAGGDPEDIWLLPGERVLPTDENPQPVARNAYNRATGDKMIISVKDVTHVSLVDDFAPISSKQNPIFVNRSAYFFNPQFKPRKAVGEDVLNPTFQGEEYIPLNWSTETGALTYLPTHTRNYYTKHWLDFYLKGEEQGLSAFTTNIAENVLTIHAAIASQ